MFIQENFFNLPFQVAYVIDPIQNLRGFFQWKNGRIEKLKGYYIYDDVGKPIKIEQTKVKKDEVAQTKTSKAANVIIALLCVATIFLSFFAISLNNKYEEQLEKQEAILSDLTQQQAEVEEQKAEIDKQNEVIQNQDVLIDELKAMLEANPENDDAVTFKAYTVVAGDSLYAICEANGLDYASNYKIILAINGIENADEIYVGQTILLPITK